MYDAPAPPGGPGAWVGWWDKAHSPAGFPIDPATGAFTVPRWAYVPDDATAGALLVVVVPAALNAVVPEPSYETPMATQAVATLLIVRTAAVAASTSGSASVSKPPVPLSTFTGGTPAGTPGAVGTMAQPSPSPPALATALVTTSPVGSGGAIAPITTPVVDGAGGGGGVVLHTNGSGTDSGAAHTAGSLLALLAPLLLAACGVMGELRAIGGVGV